MPVTRLNHAVLYVRDVERTREFYESVLDFKTLLWLPGKVAFFQAPGSTNDHDLGTFQIGAGAGPVGGRAGPRSASTTWRGRWTRWASCAASPACSRTGAALVGASDHVTTKALYAHDPDGIEFEVSWLLPADLITDEIRTEAKEARVKPLDLEAEIARYGADTRGGVGVSIPV